MDEMKKFFQTHLTEELAGVDEYFNLAEKAAEMNDSHLYHGLCEMAKDEYTHAKFIHEWLVDNGCTITTEQEMKWQQVRERAAHKFR